MDRKSAGERRRLEQRRGWSLGSGGGAIGSFSRKTLREKKRNEHGTESVQVVVEDLLIPSEAAHGYAPRGNVHT